MTNREFYEQAQEFIRGTKEEGAEVVAAWWRPYFGRVTMHRYIFVRGALRTKHGPR